MSDRPDSFERLVAALQGAGLHPTAWEVADAVWLAAYLTAVQRPAPAVQGPELLRSRDASAEGRAATPEASDARAGRSRRRQPSAGRFLEGGAGACTMNSSSVC